MATKKKNRGLYGSAFMCGVASAFNIYGSTNSFASLRESIGGIANLIQGPETDRANMANDWQNVGSDLRNTLKKYQEKEVDKA